jgi:Siphovirus ReqiPepy6 Gp37-like protein
MAILSVDAWTRVVSSAVGALNPPSVYIPPTAGSTDEVWVEILDKNLISQGPIQFVNLTAQLYYNAVGSWSMTVPYTDALWTQMMSGDFMVNINWRGLFSFGGKCETPGYTDSIPGASSGAAGAGPFITLSGADYLALIANRIAYPAPGSAWTAQTAGATDTVTSTALETAIKHYVSVNVGSGAIAARRHSLLDIASSLARGGTVTYSVKFGTGVNLNLLDVIRALIAQTNTSMGVKITRNPSTHRLLFDVYIPRDLTGKAWFSQQLGNLTSIQFSLTDPTLTDSLVQGSGTNFIQKTAVARTQWNAVESFLDSSSETDMNNLNTAAQLALLQGGVGPIINMTASDIPFLTYGRDYGLGDIVSIEVRPGAVYQDVVTGVTLTADPSATPEINVVPTVGNNASATDTNSTIIGVLSSRIRALERKLATK